MKIKKSILKTIIAAGLLMILAMNLTSNISLVSGAQGGGIGKFLTINFVSSNSEDQPALLASGIIVTATKVKSDKSFIFTANDASSEPNNPPSQRVGAGTVELVISNIPSDWEFKNFSPNVINVDELTGEYKSVK
ncbi:MAG: hypothetical protein ACTSR6_09905, partial [Candidatus Heimdallarchaeota archaeon]